MPPADQVYLNGIDAVTGQYLIDPMDYEEIKAILRSERAATAGGKSNDERSWLKRIWQAIAQTHLGLPPDVKPEVVEQAGWGIVLSENEDQAVKAALGPLIEHRRQQIQNDEIVKILTYRTGESCARWLARHGVARGSVLPPKVPYYLLLVGGPESIPFSFCHELDVEYAVGVLDFDNADEYKAYVNGVVSYETNDGVPNAKEAVFFGTRHPGDRATELSADSLVRTLADGDATAREDKGVAAKWGFRSRKIWATEATKSSLTEVFNPANDEGSPAFLFTATHGMGFPRGHIEQTKRQGALLCQDWPGLGSVKPSNYFAADDLSDKSSVSGLVMFCFACFGAGTPSHDRFIHRTGEEPAAIADRPFISAFAKRLLSHPAGGALAFIGHVERAWGCSIVTPNAGIQILPFQNAIGRILKGEPIGFAMKDFNERYAALSTDLTNLLEQASFGMKVPDVEIAASWVGRNDAEGYLLLGDPAIRLRVSDLL